MGAVDYDGTCTMTKSRELVTRRQDTRHDVVPTLGLRYEVLCDGGLVFHDGGTMASLGSARPRQHVDDQSSCAVLRTASVLGTANQGRRCWGGSYLLGTVRYQVDLLTPFAVAGLREQAARNSNTRPVRRARDRDGR